MDNENQLPDLFLQRLSHIVSEKDIDKVIASFSKDKPVTFRF